MVDFSRHYDKNFHDKSIIGTHPGRNAAPVADAVAQGGRLLRSLCDSCPDHGIGKPGEDGQVDVQGDAIKPPDAQRERAPPVLEGAELALDSAALMVERLPPGSAARDERVQPSGLDPYRGG